MKKKIYAKIAKFCWTLYTEHRDRSCKNASLVDFYCDIARLYIHSAILCIQKTLKKQNCMYKDKQNKKKHHQPITYYIKHEINRQKNV